MRASRGAMLLVRCGISDNVRKPCAIVTLYGDSFAERSGSMWMNW